ncbi:Protein of unknown function [Bacillus mycoides]|nr:Protein of unknown function [Bacillus mycoides]
MMFFGTAFISGLSLIM